MKQEQPKYFNFPIVLLEGFMVDSSQVLANIYAYATYVKIQSYIKEDSSFNWVANEDIEKAVSLSDSYFGIKVDADKEDIYNKGELLFESIPLNTPTAGINIDIWKSYYQRDKTEFEKVCLLIFLAIKSVLGKQAQCKSNKKILFNRLVGNIDGSLELEDFEEPLFKYANRRRLWDKINLELQMNWGLKYFSQQSKGFYISLTKDENKFYLDIMEQKKQTKEQKFKEEKKAKIEQAKRILEQKEKSKNVHLK